MKRVVLITSLLIITGCVAVPVINDAGEPVLKPDGTPKTKQVFAPGSAADAATAAAPFLPPPFNLIVPAVAGLAVSVVGRRKRETTK